MNVFIFPGQGAQFPGMGLDAYKSSKKIKAVFDEADEILGFKLSKIMFEGSDDELKQTKVTQPAIFLHSIAELYLKNNEIKPDFVAGHSLGEFSALVANNTISFEDGLKLVSIRAKAMQKACENNKGGMAAILGLDDELIEKTCKNFEGNVVAANFNCPGQVVISGELDNVKLICEKFNKLGARRSLLLPVSGAFHSELMIGAKDELREVINNISLQKPSCPIYQNVNGKPELDTDTIKINLINQLTSSVKWTQSVKNMIKDGANNFIEFGPGKVLCGLIKKVDREVNVQSAF
jgi:[acyl-carrier-protein] S-malonyltransferase